MSKTMKSLWRGSSWTVSAGSTYCDVEGLTDLNEVHDLLSSLIRPIAAEADADSQPRLLLVRIHLRGCTALHGDLRSAKDQLRDDIEATLQHCGQEFGLSS